MKALKASLLFGTVAIVLCTVAAAAIAGPRAMIWDSAATPSWTAGIAGAGAVADTALDVKLLKGGVTLVAGSLANTAGNLDLSLTKYVGSTRKWTRKYDGPGHGPDGAFKLAVSRDGKWVYTAGLVTNAAGNIDLVVVKRSVTSGARKWTRRYDGPAHGNETCAGVGVDRDGNVVVGGTTDTSWGAEWVIVSWTQRGTLRWTRRYDTGGHTLSGLFDLLVRPDGSTYAAGMGIVKGGKQAAVTARLSRKGALLWAKTYLGPAGLGATLTDIVARPGGGVYVCGYTARAATGMDGMVLRYLPSGTRKLFTLDSYAGGTTQEVFVSLAVTTDKSIVAVGFTQGALQQPHVAYYTPDGALSGTQTLPTAFNDRFVAVVADALGGYCATSTLHAAAADCRICTYRASMLAGGGGWYGTWTWVASSENAPTAMAVRGTDVCVVGKYQSGGPSDVDQVVLYYRY